MDQQVEVGDGQQEQSELHVNAPDEIWDQRFKATETGIYVHSEKGEGEWKKVCSPLYVAAEGRDANGKGWGLLVELPDADGTCHEIFLARECLAGTGDDYRRVLLDHGLWLAPGHAAKKNLEAYLATTQPKRRIRIVDRVGWYGETCFVMPDQVIGIAPNNERVVLRKKPGIVHAYAVCGTLADWQEAVARPAVGNSRLTFAISVALAAPLVSPMGYDGGIVHLRGASWTGKSTALIAASSVWGGGRPGYVRQWRATDNGLEGIAALHSDTLLALDELSQIDARAAGSATYMLANGAGKARAARDGSLRQSTSFTCIGLSSGEVGLADKLMEVRQDQAAGMAVRMIDIPADADAGHGLFEDLHGATSAATFAQSIKDGACRAYGSAGPAFVSYIVENREEVLRLADTCRRRFVDRVVPADADGQVRRVADRFGLIAAGGELAARAGLVPWKRGDASRAAAICFEAWLAQRGGVGAAEIEQAKARLHALIEKDGASRFQDWDRGAEGVQNKVINRAGFVRWSTAEDGDGTHGRTPEYYVLPVVWREEIMHGLDARSITKALVAEGVILCGGDTKPSSTHAPPSNGKSIRLYRIAPTFGEE